MILQVRKTEDSRTATVSDLSKRVKSSEVGNVRNITSCLRMVMNSM